MGTRDNFSKYDKLFRPFQCYALPDEKGTVRFFAILYGSLYIAQAYLREKARRLRIERARAEAVEQAAGSASGGDPAQLGAFAGDRTTGGQDRREVRQIDRLIAKLEVALLYIERAISVAEADRDLGKCYMRGVI